jgi:Ni,Fe-hydrogenase I large subunit
MKLTQTRKEFHEYLNVFVRDPKSSTGIPRLPPIRLEPPVTRITIDPITRIEGHLRIDCEVEDGKIKNYQAVVPTTWNAGPRDDSDRIGPYEASLLDNPVADPEAPLEVLRTVHSFDPCLACAIHMVDEERRPIVRVKAR